MLGSIKSPQIWHFGAAGKHPALKDYFKAGEETALMQVFFEWVKSGYRLFVDKRESAPSLHSWRFWAKDSERKALSCGLIRDSSDSLGRSYPILIMGTGPLDGWEEEWWLLPEICERTWNPMEHLCTRIFDGFNQLEEGVKNIPSPLLRGSESAGRKEKFKVGGEYPGSYNPFFPLSTEREFWVSFDGGTTYDLSSWVRQEHFLFKSRFKDVPNSVFMGGTLEKIFLAFFRKPLTPADFMKLWSVSSPGSKRNGSYIAG